jgi:hypothetical protein
VYHTLSRSCEHEKLLTPQFQVFLSGKIVFMWGSAWIGSFAAWKCTMNQPNDRRSMMMSRRVLFLRIYWIVIRHSVPRWISVLGFSPANCDTVTFYGIDHWCLVKCRFSATQSSKRGRKRLANGMFLCQRWFWNLNTASPFLVASMSYFLLTQFLSFQVRPVAEEEMFKVLRTGKRKSKWWCNLLMNMEFGYRLKGLCGMILISICFVELWCATWEVDNWFEQPMCFIR